MPSFRTCIFAHQQRNDGSYNIKLRITHHRIKRFLATNLYVSADYVTRGLKIKDEKVNRKCRALEDQCIDICNELGFSVEDMDVDTLAARIKSKLKGDDKFHLDFAEYMEAAARKMKPGTGSIYITALNALKRYAGRESIDIGDINASFISGFVKFIEAEPSQRGSNRKNGRKDSACAKGGRALTLYLSRIKTIWNRAKEEFNDEERGVIPIKGNPFRSIRLGSSMPTAKRALSAGTIQRMIDLPPFEDRLVQQARDCFLLSFALMGMNSADMHTCVTKRKDVIVYNRQKTAGRRADHAEMQVRIEPSIEPLVERYLDKTGCKVFQFHIRYANRGNFNSALNKGLKAVGEAVGVPGLTFYAARHSWATIARTPKSRKPDEIGGAGLDKYIVHEGLNHIDPTMKVTDIYLVKNWEILWDANKAVLDLFDWHNV